MAVFVFSVLFLSGITLNCIFTIFNLKISDSLQLREQQTDCVQMATITGLCSKIVNVICFNYMVICGEVSLDYESQPFHTSFVEFYGSMLKTPFFGSYYNVIAPALILLLGLVFAALGFFKYHSKTLEALLLFNLKRENSSDNKASRIDKQFQSNKSFVEKVLIGEKAILKEYDQLKTKCERKRVTGFGGGYGSILGSFSG